jgi:hypothetical protein
VVGRLSRLGDNARFRAYYDQPGVVAHPLPVQHLIEQLEARLALSHVDIVQPSNTHFARLRAELERLGTAGEPHHGCPPGRPRNGARYILYSTDTDFARLSGLLESAEGSQRVITP